VAKIQAVAWPPVDHNLRSSNGRYAFTSLQRQTLIYRLIDKLRPSVKP
jgi:hypothetical protein